MINPKQWAEAETFMETTVKSNIEKYRKADVTLQFVDPSGRPIQELPVSLVQTKNAFVFGASLGWFDPASASINAADGDQNPGGSPIELEKFPEAFNGSMIAFSSKWAFMDKGRIPLDGPRQVRGLLHAAQHHDGVSPPYGDPPRLGRTDGRAGRAERALVRPHQPGRCRRNFCGTAMPWSVATRIASSTSSRSPTKSS